MKTLEKRQARTFLGAVVSDPYRKLASIALAIGLWFFLDTQIERNLPLTVRLVAIGAERTTPLVNQLSVELPTNQVVGRRFLNTESEIEMVDVVLSGPRYRIDTIEKRVLDLQVKFPPNLDWTDRKSIEITVADIDTNLSALQDVRIEMRPSRIRLEVERIMSSDLLLQPDLVNLHVDDPESLGKRLRLDTAKFSPETARILGPASSLKIFESRAQGSKPLQAHLNSASNDRQITTILELTTPSELGLRLAETPSMTIQVLPHTEVFELEVQVRIDDLALPSALQGHYRPDPETRTRMVRIRAGGQLRSHLTILREHPDKDRLRDWALAHLRLNVWIPPPEAGATPLPDMVREAVLVLQGPLRSNVDRNECELAQPETFTLRKMP